MQSKQCRRTGLRLQVTELQRAFRGNFTELIDIPSCETER